MFRKTYGGFQVDFPNGLTLSTMFGWPHYCANYFKEELVEKYNSNESTKESMWDILESKNAEIAIRFGDDFITKHVLDYDDDVKGYVEITEWLEIFDKCRNFDVDKLNDKTNR